MKRLFGFLFALLFASSSPLLAQRQLDHFAIYQFTDDFIESLWHYHESQRHISKLNPESLPPRIDSKTSIEFMSKTHRANNALEKARRLMEKHQNSQNDLVLSVLMSVSFSYNRQMEVNLARVKLMGKLIENQDGVAREKYIQEQSKIEKRGEETLTKLMNSALMITYLFVHRKPDEDGKMSILAITEQERDATVLKLESYFGDSLKQEFKPGMNFAIAPAAILYKSLTKPDWKTIDQL